MPVAVTPAKKLANGRDTWWLVPTITNQAAPTAVQINATTGGMNINGVLTAEYEGASTSTEKVTLPRVLMETTTTEVNGQTSNSLADMEVAFQPQAASGSDGKKAWELFTGGRFTGYAVRRQDIAGTTGDATTGQFVDVFPVDCVRNAPTKTSTGADGIYTFTISLGVTGTPSYNVAVV